MKEVVMNCRQGFLSIVVILMLSGLLYPNVASAQDYRMSLDVNPLAARPGTTVTVRVLLEVLPGAPGPVGGSALGVSHDPTLYTLNSVVEGADLVTLPPCGVPPMFLQIQPLPGGFTLGVLHHFTSSACDFGPGCYELAVGTYTSLALQTTTNSFQFSNTLGSPPLNTVVVVNGVTVVPDFITGPPSNLTCSTSGGMITLSWTNNGAYGPLEVECNGVTVATVPAGASSYTFTPAATGIVICKLVTEACGVVYQTEGCGVSIAGQTFIRCDCNRDGIANIADAICILNVLFAGGSFSCEDAADGNDDGNIDVADVISCLTAQFFGGTTPAPSPGCGVDPTPDSLGCAIFPACP